MRARICKHDYFVVPGNGNAYGAASGTKLHDAVGDHGRAFADAMACHVIAAGLTVPEVDYEFGRHPVRAAFARAIIMKQGLVAAASYLGDRLATVEMHYASVEGTQVDSSLVADFRTPIDLGRAPIRHRSRSGAADKSGQQRDVIERDYATGLTDLVSAYRDGLINAYGFAKAKRDPSRRTERYRLSIIGGRASPLLPDDF